MDERKERLSEQLRKTYDLIPKEEIPEDLKRLIDRLQ